MAVLVACRNGHGKDFRAIRKREDLYIRAIGEVRAVLGKNLRTGNIWEGTELPRLKTNPKVTKIITIDPETMIETIIFTR